MDSNHLPPRYQHGALPVELAAQRQDPRANESSGSFDFTKPDRPTGRAPEGWELKGQVTVGR